LKPNRYNCCWQNFCRTHPRVVYVAKKYTLPK